jgi:hypothetical protein
MQAHNRCLERGHAERTADGLTCGVTYDLARTGDTIFGMAAYTELR